MATTLYICFTDTPWGSLPVIKIDGREYAQMNAIARHISHFTGTAAGSRHEAAFLDQIADVGAEFWYKFAPYLIESEETVKVRTVYEYE